MAGCIIGLDAKSSDGITTDVIDCAGAGTATGTNAILLGELTSETSCWAET